MTYRKAAALEELWSGDMTARRVEGCAVLLVRLGADVYAYEDRCAHLGVPLSAGCLADGVLTCSAHQWQYDVRSGAGVNPASARLRPLGVKIEDGDILVDVGPDRPMSPDSHDRGARVGPVLETSEAARAVVAAIRQLNADVLVEDRGSYLRVLVPGRCVVTRAAIEAILGQPFRLPADLEPLMPAFKGRLSVTEDAVVWAFGRSP